MVNIRERVAQNSLVSIIYAFAGSSWGGGPADVTLLLTSRPATDWPAGLFRRAKARFGEGEGLTTLDLMLQEKPYVELVQRYFTERLRPLFRSRAQHLRGLLENKTPFEKGGRDPRLTNDPTLRDALKDHWKKPTNEFPRWTGQPFPVIPIIGILSATSCGRRDGRQDGTPFQPCRGADSAPARWLLRV